MSQNTSQKSFWQKLNKSIFIIAIVLIVFIAGFIIGRMVIFKEAETIKQDLVNLTEGANQIKLNADGEPVKDKEVEPEPKDDIITKVSDFITGKNAASAKDITGNVYNQDTQPDFLIEDVDFKLFWDTWKLIKNNYVRQPVNETQLLYGALAGSVASLGDPHSVFFDPVTTSEFRQELQGSFEGIGAEIAIKNERLTIVAPLPDTPAEKAGLRAGDKVYAIDGEDTTGISLDYAVSKIRGPKGTEVILTVVREGVDETIDITITRGSIHVVSVSWEELEGNIVHLKLRYFNEDTDQEFYKAVSEIVAKNPKGIIFDMRNNPGGYLDVAIKVASEWVDNKDVVYERKSDGKLMAHKARGQARLKDFKTVVLINGGSASGSEIVAGALKDYKLGTLVGETTFGKGSVQSLFPLKDGSSIKLTVAEWLTPSENLIDQQGIDPDVEVELTDEDFNNDRDPQLQKAIEILNAK